MISIIQGQGEYLRVQPQDESDTPEEVYPVIATLRCGTPSSPTRPATLPEPHTDSHRAGVRWNCKPEISNAHAQDSSAFMWRRMSITTRLTYTRSHVIICINE